MQRWRKEDAVAAILDFTEEAQGCQWSGRHGLLALLGTYLGHREAGTRLTEDTNPEAASTMVCDLYNLSDSMQNPGTKVGRFFSRPSVHHGRRGAYSLARLLFKVIYVRKKMNYCDSHP
jgi:hypothetical protein